jgi:hypothetical protein
VYNLLRILQFDQQDDCPEGDVLEHDNNYDVEELAEYMIEVVRVT